MKFNLDLQITNKGRYPLDEERLFGVVMRALGREARPASPTGGSLKLEARNIEISLLVVDKEEMAEYNLRYHETEGPTDVLSFPYTDPESQTSDVEFVDPPGVVVLGDLIVCYPVAVEEAEKQGKTPQEMVEFYVDHGLKHLLGHHHE